MSDQPEVTALEAGIHELARAVRDARHLEPQARGELTELVDELREALLSAALSPAEAGHLAEGTAKLAQALRQHHEPSLLERARERLLATVAWAESDAPVAAGFARRLLDAIANLGI
jgi:hypothetical protein